MTSQITWYEIERRDRGTDPHRGVFIAVKKDLIATREPELETGCEIMWCKLQISVIKRCEYCSSWCQIGMNVYSFVSR